MNSNSKTYNPIGNYRSMVAYTDSDEEVFNCHSYSLKTGQTLDKITLENIKDASPNSNEFIWLGLYNPSLETLEKVQKAFSLHDLSIEDALNLQQQSKVESYNDETLFVLVQTAKLNNNQIDYGTTSIFVGKNYIVTLRTGPSNSYKPVREYYERRPEKLKMGPIFLLHAILDFVVDNYLPITDKLAHHLDEQEHNIFSYDFSKDTLRGLYELKTQLVRMRSIMMPVQDICNYFLNHKKDELPRFFPSEAKPYFRDIKDHIQRSIEAVNGLNEMLSVAMDTYMAIVNMGQNEVFRKLAAWAGILAVPTAIAGIYGMNFVFMPELEYKYAYPIVLLIILVACGYLYYKFKRSGWL